MQKCRINVNGKHSRVGPRDLKIVPMQMPFEITAVAFKRNTGTFCPIK